jgi:hypothetical protein
MIERKNRKKVGSVELPAWCFAYAPDPDKPYTWKLPIFHPDKKRELNLVLSAVQRFRESPSIPVEERPAAWLKITRQAFKHRVTVPRTMPTAAAPPRKIPHHQQVNTFKQHLTNEEKAEKAITADAALRAERFLKSIGY